MKHQILTRAAFGAVASAAVLLPLAGCSTDSDTQSSSAVASTTLPANSSPRAASGTGYQDGTYTVRGVCGGAPSYMTITVGLRNDTITDVDVEPMPENNDTSRGYQERFAAAVPDEVVGKSIDDLEVGTLAGASGCADGFNDAIAKIRDQARI